MAKFLVLGGAGYIGSHMVNYLLQKEHDVVVFDNLSTGHSKALLSEHFELVDVLDLGGLHWAFQKHGRFDCVIHFCARSLVGESVQDPALYYQNNVMGTLNLLNVMRKTGHSKLIFSSTAAIFGEPMQKRINEAHVCAPINPYGRSKLMVEMVLKDFTKAYGIDSVCLRYFNAAGADPSGKIGEKHEPETHLIPNILKSARAPNETALKVFGNDYDTPDGSCVRDYIHVNDLAGAHFRAFQFLNENAGAYCFNLGIGRGFSVLEVIRAAEKVTGKRIDYEFALRRVGDPASLVADPSLALNYLGWQPQYTRLEDIIQTAWDFMQADDDRGVS